MLGLNHILQISPKILKLRTLKARGFFYYLDAEALTFPQKKKLIMVVGEMIISITP
jgi:hypothetical protein